MKLKLIALGALATMTVSANAAIIWLSDIGSWNASTGGAAMTEDFSGFGVDTQFRSQSVAINGGTIRQLGTDHGFRNTIDVPSLDFSDNNGTANASMFVDKDPTTSPTTVEILFDTPQSGFGFNAWGARDGEGVAVQAYNGNTFIGAAGVLPGDGIFHGFIIPDGPLVDRVVFVAVSGNGTPASGEGFGMDNLVYADAVPEPATMALLGLGAAAVLRRRNRK